MVEGAFRQCSSTELINQKIKTGLKEWDIGPICIICTRFHNLAALCHQSQDPHSLTAELDPVILHRSMDSRYLRNARNKLRTSPSAKQVHDVRPQGPT